MSIIPFCGHMFEPLPSGGLFWRAENTLLVADLHFEKMASFARRGQLLPPYDTGLTLSALAKDLHKTGANKLIALGDSFHRDDSVAQMQADDRARLKDIMAQVDWVWISGNHDPSPHSLGGACLAQLNHQGIEFAHMPSSDAKARMCGHLHPAARIHINARSVRRPCFATDGNIFILPAFGASTGSLNILSAPFEGIFQRANLRVTMLGTNQTYAVNSDRLIRG